MIQFFWVFVVLIFIGSLFCIGWNGITRGWVEYLPDGTKFNAGQILGGWERFWEYNKGIKRFYYDYDGLKKKLFELKYLDNKIGEKLYMGLYGISINPNIFMDDTEVVKMEHLLGCKVDCQGVFKDKQGFGFGCMNLYIERPIYRFPEWIRKPISACVRCYASVYGSFIWWSFVFIQKDAFNWCNNKIVAILTFWFIFMVILSGVNVFFNKKMKE